MVLKADEKSENNSHARACVFSRCLSKVQKMNGLDMYANCKGSRHLLVAFRMNALLIFSNTFTATDVKAIDQKSLRC